ncbi:hypothetical protein AmDm5_1546 [Acetobacter malorum]|nr:hypothetical protein [Acetobacter malorum]KFL89650.1 hypothetical protein AmDm5_1546 [Acetobacter malorum]
MTSTPFPHNPGQIPRHAVPAPSGTASFVEAIPPSGYQVAPVQRFCVPSFV